ncbi:MAG: hypothetical protein ACRYG7_24910 [Janthinobacterium lividum]
MAESLVLLPSSLWDAQNGKNKMVSDGRFYIPDPTAGNDSLPILDTERRLLLGQSPHKIQKLKKVFPVSKSLKSSFLRSQGDSWVITRYQDEQTFIIPCFELLRAFYYIGTPHLIEFFFSLTPLSTLCQLLEAPTERNGQTVRIAVAADGFSQHQLCVLAELCLNQAYLQTVEKAHNRFFPNALRGEEGKNVKVDFCLGRDVELEVTGFAFTYEERPFFWVCGIRSHSPYWSFRQLEYTVGSDHRIGKITSGDEPTISPTVSGQLVTPSPTTSAPITDSGEDGASNSQVDALFSLALYTDLPETSCLPKEEQERRYPTLRSHFSVMPEYLTTEGGGKDLRKLRLTRSGLTTKVDLPIYFASVIKHLAQLQDFSITLLNLNNPKNKWGNDVAIFPIWQAGNTALYWQGEEPHRIAIAQIGHSGGTFYFAQLLAGGRATLIYYQTARVIEDRELNNLLEYFALTNYNWQRVGAIYRNEEFFQKTKDQEYEIKDQEKVTIATRFRRNMGAGLIIDARNHTKAADGNPSAAALCEKIIRDVMTQPSRESG